MTTVVTARLSDDVLDLVDRLAISRDRSRAWILAKLIESGARKQLEMDDFIKVGADAFEAGNTIPHDELVETIMQRRAGRAAA